MQRFPALLGREGDTAEVQVRPSRCGWARWREAAAGASVGPLRGGTGSSVTQVPRLCPGTAQGRFAEGRGMTMYWLQWSLAVLRMLLVGSRVCLLDVVVCYSGCAKVQHCNYNQKPDNVL